MNLKEYFSSRFPVEQGDFLKQTIECAFEHVSNIVLAAYRGQCGEDNTTRTALDVK